MPRWPVPPVVGWVAPTVGTPGRRLDTFVGGKVHQRRLGPRREPAVDEQFADGQRKHEIARKRPPHVEGEWGAPARQGRNPLATASRASGHRARQRCARPINDPRYCTKSVTSCRSRPTRTRTSPTRRAAGRLWSSMRGGLSGGRSRSRSGAVHGPGGGERRNHGSVQGNSGGLRRAARRWRTVARAPSST